MPHLTKSSEFLRINSFLKANFFFFFEHSVQPRLRLTKMDKDLVVQDLLV